MSNDKEILGTNVKLLWQDSTDSDDGDYEGDPNYKGYWVTEAMDSTKRNLSYTFTIEKIHGQIVVKDLDVDYPFEETELDDMIEALELLRNMRNLMRDTESTAVKE